MKKTILLIILLSIGIVPSFSGQLYMEDSLFFDNINIQADFDSTYGSIDLQYLPVNNILIDRTLWITPPEEYNGKDTTDTLNNFTYYMVYTSYRNSHYNIPSKIIPTDSLKSIVKNYFDNYIPISMIFFEYSKIKENAHTDSLLYVNNEIIYDQPGRTENPYERDTLFAGISTKGYLENGYVNFILDSSKFMFSNLYSDIDSIKADFGDGTGFKILNYNDTVNVSYYSTGYHTIKFYAYINNKIYKAFNKVYVNNSAAMSLIGSPDDIPDLEFSMTANSSYFGSPASGTVSVFYGCEDNSIKKPFIIAPGYDPFENQRTPEIIRVINARTLYDKNGNDFVNALVNEMGYDLIVLDYDKSSDYIQNNALLLEKLIDWTNGQLQSNGSDKDITLFGYSMGGLVGRYALLDMEQNSIEHNVQLFITGDTPHQGANVPLGYQKLARDGLSIYTKVIDEAQSQLSHLLSLISFISGGGILNIFFNFLVPQIIVSNIDNFVYKANEELMAQLLDSPAAKQMLIYRLSEYNEVNENESLKTDLFSEMQAMGDYPEKCRNVAITDGSMDDTEQTNLNPGDQMFGWNHLTWYLTIRLNVWANSHNTTSYEQLLDVRVKYKKVRWWFPVPLNKVVVDINAKYKNLPAYDPIPGGYIDANKQVAEGINNALSSFQPAGDYDRPNFCFVPTYSALDIEVTDPSFDLIVGNDGVEYGLENGLLSTPFDGWYSIDQTGEIYNQNHTYFGYDFDFFDLFDNELFGNNNYYGYFGSGNLFVEERTIKSTHDLLYEAFEEIRLGSNDPAVTGNFTIESSGRLRSYAGKQVTMLDWFVAESGSEYHAKIVTFPDCSGGMLKSGEKPDIEIFEDPEPVLDLEEVKIDMLYPNPTEGVLNIVYSISQGVRFDSYITDLSGRKVMDLTKCFNNGKNKLYTLDGSALPSGSYYLIISSSEGIISRTFKIMR